MARAGLRPVHKYSDEFKLAAVRLSRPSGIQVKAVVAALALPRHGAPSDSTHWVTDLSASGGERGRRQGHT
jgi:transposase-like protein